MICFFMGKNAYSDYMKSPEWSERKKKYFLNHERKCRACYSKSYIEVHHKTYARLGQERDQDLVALCRRCHRSLHAEQKRTGENLWKNTESFIKKKRLRIKKSQTVKTQPSYRRSKNDKNKTSNIRRGRKMAK